MARADVVEEEDVGVYPGIQLKIELLNYPMVTPIIKTF